MYPCSSCGAKRDPACDENTQNLCPFCAARFRAQAARSGECLTDLRGSYFHDLAEPLRSAHVQVGGWSTESGAYAKWMADFTYHGAHRDGSA